MRFIWDERKRRANLRKHAIDFADVVDVFSGYTLKSASSLLACFVKL
jgi:uncharacterized DUF497 family protein